MALARSNACVAGVDEFNNDNIDEGGNQAAINFDNMADQINEMGRRLLATPGFQFNGESFWCTCSP